MTPLRARGTAALSATQAVVLGGLTVGTLDLAAAFFTNPPIDGARFVRLLHVIAGGLLGSDSFEGGAATAALGLAAHFFIAFIVVVTFYLASRRLPVLLRRPVVSGLVYGAVVYAVMYYVVLPLSAWQTDLYRPLPAVLKGLAIHLACVGLPAALIIRAGPPPVAAAAPVSQEGSS